MRISNLVGDTSENEERYAAKKARGELGEDTSADLSSRSKDPDPFLQ